MQVMKTNMILPKNHVGLQNEPVFGRKVPNDQKMCFLILFRITQVNCEKCCHPLLATENLKDDRAPDCTPSASQLSSASAAFATSTAEPGVDGEDDCDDGDDEPASTPAPTSSKKPETKASSSAKNEAAKATATTSSSSKKEESTEAPEPSSTKKDEPSSSKTSSSVKATKTSSSGSLGDLITGGIATFFTQNGVAGACGKVNPDSALVAALETKTFANGAHCGKSVEITNKKNGKKATVKVADECPTCNNPQSIDLSTGAFKALGGTTEEGIFDIAWQFVN